MDGLQELPIHLGRNHQPGLRTKVVADFDDVDVRPQLAQEVAHERFATLGDGQQQGLGDVGTLHHVDQELIETLHSVRPLEREEQPGRGQDGVLPVRGQLSRLGGDVRHPRGVVHVRPAGIVLDFGDGCGVGQGMQAGNQTSSARLLP